jgi:hypothetical protein
MACAHAGCPGSPPPPPDARPPPTTAPPGAGRADDLRPLAALVPAGAAARDRYGIDASGRFFCQEALAVTPGAEDAACAMADGFEIEATVEHALAPGARDELRAVVPLRLFRRSACGARRDPVPNPAPALLARVAPGLTRGPARIIPGALAGAACRDPRLAVRLAGAEHRFVPPTVHRFQPLAGEATVTVELRGKPLRAFTLRREVIPSGCPADPTPALPWTLDLEALCEDDHAVLTFAVWRPALSSACIPAQPGARLAEPGPPACALGPVPRRSWIPREQERIHVDLRTGAVAPLIAAAVELHP